MSSVLQNEASVEVLGVTMGVSVRVKSAGTKLTLKDHTRKISL